MPIVLAGLSLLSMRGGWRRGLRIMEPEGADLSEPLRARDGQGSDRMQEWQTECGTRINRPMTSALRSSLRGEQVAAQCSHK
jgi:hypothetical protein